ncbi:MAG: isoprenylcysteine carboxylmethyltransferase family protein [Sedimentisphaerales bacterium]|nr:isoprenylcysteine carboxylmethyltransferase family protein [Sedimentisphaerales bacterium]
MVDRSELATPARVRLEKPGIVVLVGSFLGAFIEATLLFAAAGRLDLPRAWLFLVVSLVGMFGQSVLVAAVNPGLVNHRGSWKKKKDTIPWDKLLLTLYGLLAFYVVPVVIGLDAGRYQWSSLGAWAAVVGTLLFAAGTVVLTWAMLVNTHFEATVRIQHDRGHRVVTAGPYRVVRHPGYVGASLWALAGPLIVGSAFGLIPAAGAVAVLIVRTALEDKTLQAQLPGYTQYAKKTKFRLLPPIW